MQDQFARSLAAGEILFRQGDRGDCAYVIETGLLEVSVDRAGERELLSRVGPGALIGEMALLDNSTRMATVEAVEPCTLRVLTRNHLTERLGTADPLLRHILHLTIARYRDVVQRRGGPAQPVIAAVADWTSAEQDLVIDRLRLETELENALREQQFVLHYQPILRLEDETVAGFEALIRWRHPKRGLIMPDAFITLAEQCGLIARMGHWIIRTAIDALGRLDALAGRQAEPLFMTVNLSARQFSDPELVPALRRALRESAIEPNRLLLEITESSLLDRMELAARLMRECEALGVRVSVDDFGTGYSALSYLYRLPVSSIKFARAFIRDLAAYPAGEKIVGAVARLATDLNMDTVCEGIETAAQAAAVRRLGVRYGQGFHYAAGMPLPIAARYIRTATAPAKRARKRPKLVRSAGR